jgi:hypothetical protein
MPKLAIDIEAKYAQVMDALDQIGRKADSQAKSIQTAFRLAGTAIGAAIGSFSVLAVDDIANSIAAYKDLGDQMGDSAEAVSGLQRAADLSGVSLDQVTQASIKLTSALAKGGEEGKGVAKALSAINIQFDEFKRLSPVAQIELVARKLAEFEDGAGKTALAVDLFGKSGAQLIPFFNDLAEAGGRTARLTQEQIDAADAYTKSLARLKSEFGALTQSIAADAIPVLNKLLETMSRVRETSVLGFLTTSGEQEKNAGAEIGRITESLEKLKKTRDELDPGKGFANKLNDIVFGDVGDLDKQIAVLEKQRSYLKAVQAARALAEKIPDERRFQPDPRPVLDYESREKAGGKSGSKASARESEAERLTKWMVQQEQSAAKLNVLEQTALKIAEAREKAGHGITSAIEDELLARARAIVEQQKAKDLAESQGEFEAFMSKVLADDARRVKDLADAWREALDPAEQYRKKLREITELEAGGQLNESEASAARQFVIDQMESLDRQKESIAEIDEYARNAAQSMQQSFSDFLFDPFEKGLKGLAEGFARTVQRMAADALAAQLMRSLFGDYAKTGALGGILGSVFGAGTGMSTNGTDTTLRALEGLNGIDYGGFSPKSADVSLTQNVTIQAGAGGVSDFATRQALREVAVAGVRDAQVRGELR